MPLVRFKTKSQVTIPDAIRQQLGVQVGDLLEATVDRGAIVLRPKVVIDRPARGAYTPAQRRSIDARLNRALADVQADRTAGPFETADAMVASMKRELKRRNAKKIPARRSG